MSQSPPPNMIFEHITDQDAVEAAKAKSASRGQICDTFATRTILYPVEIERKAGRKETEIRPYVIMGQQYPERTWKKALDVEKRYPQLNKDYQAYLKAKKLPTSRKDPGNSLLNIVPIEDV